MANLAVNRVTNANVYLDGIGLLGRAEEIEVAKPKHKMIDHKGLGMAGSAEFWAGVDKLEAKIKWASIYPEAEMALNSPFQAHYFQVRSNLETYTSQGRTQEQPLV
ncbi:MAG: phage major tail tube protein [Gemmataceae bacterium]